MSLIGEPKISVVIVTWNIRPILERCLRSVDQFADAPFEVLVIDNDSKDDTREFLKTYRMQNPLLTRYEVILNEANLGYSTAVNKGLAKATGEYVLCLNPDTRLLGPTFSKMLEVANRLPDAGAVGFRILNPSGKTQWSISRLPSFAFQLKSRLGLNKQKFDYDHPAEVEQINASVALIPKKVLDQVGLWDPKYFLWFEENDFCVRAKRAGFKIYYSPEVQVMHESQAGIKTIPFWKRQLIWEKSMFRYFRKHHGFFQAMIIVLLDVPAMMIGLVIQKFKTSNPKKQDPNNKQ